jgi:uncharacterized protein YbjT (DUF2867 family)
LEQAVRDAQALFFVVPPNLTSRDPMGYAQRFADTASGEIKKSPNLKVVLLSSVGAHRATGTGPIAGLHYAEEKLRAVGRNFVALRPNYFMQNIFNSLPTIVSDGNIYTAVPASVTAPQIATADIAEFAADILLSAAAGQRVIDIAGPDDLSFGESAETIGQAIGKPVRVVTVPGGKLKVGYVQAGLSPEVASLFIEMQEAFTQGLPHELLGDEKRVGRTTYAEFVRDVFVPAVKNASASVA